MGALGLPQTGSIMIEEPPPLVFAPAVERPPAELVEGFRGASTSFIVDAMGGSGALDWRIRPIVGHSFLGVALTCDCGANDNLALIAACGEVSRATCWSRRRAALFTPP